jgi:hypothetical protein
MALSPQYSAPTPPLLGYCQRFPCVSLWLQIMEPLVSKYADDSLPPGLLIAILPISQGKARRIRLLTGEQIAETACRSGSFRHLGQVVVTPAARTSLRNSDWMLALDYHLRGESAAARPDDPTLHFRDILKGWAVLAAYRSSVARTFWIVAESDRSRTTVLMPREVQSSDYQEESDG